jgi:HSP20 family protein
MLSLYRPLSQLLRDDFMDREFGAVFGQATSPQPPVFNPAVDIVDSGEAYTLKAELPGLDPAEIDLQINNNVLTLKGERRHASDEERAGYRRVERRYGTFSRSFTLPEGTPVDSIEAQSDNGVLTITIPKVVNAPSRRVEVKAASLVDKAKKIFAKSAEDKE